MLIVLSVKRNVHKLSIMLFSNKMLMASNMIFFNYSLYIIYQYCNNGVSKEKDVIKMIDNKWVFYKLLNFH